MYCFVHTLFSNIYLPVNALYIQHNYNLQHIFMHSQIASVGLVQACLKYCMQSHHTCSGRIEKVVALAFLSWHRSAETQCPVPYVCMYVRMYVVLKSMRNYHVARLQSQFEGGRGTHKKPPR